MRSHRRRAGAVDHGKALDIANRIHRLQNPVMVALQTGVKYGSMSYCRVARGSSSKRCAFTNPKSCTLPVTSVIF